MSRNYAVCKILPDNGEILFIEKSRKLEIVSYIIPNWDTKRDCKMFYEMLDNNKEFKYCKSSKCGGRLLYNIIIKKVVLRFTRSAKKSEQQKVAHFFWTSKEIREI